MIQKILDTDTQLFLWLNNLGTEEFDNLWLWMSNEHVWISVYIIFLWILFQTYTWKKVLFLIVLISISLIISENLSFYMKELVERLRPCRNPELIGKFRLVLNECHGVYGFYSAHASNHFTLSVALMYPFQRFRFATIGLLLWASAIAYSRIYIGVHYPLDVMVGALVGTFLGFISRIFAQRFINLDQTYPQ